MKSDLRQNSPIDKLQKITHFIYALRDAILELSNMQREDINHLCAADLDPCLNVTDIHFIKALHVLTSWPAALVVLSVEKININLRLDIYSARSCTLSIVWLT